MGQPREDLYFLTDQDGLSYYVNEYMVGKSAMPVPVPVGPDGWLTKSIKFARSAKYLFGMFRTFTDPLKFVREAAKILRTRLYLNGTEDRTYLNIYRLDKSFGGGWVHKLFYKGEIDLTQADDEETYISANIMEGDLTKYVNANSSTVYSIPLNVPEAVMVKEDGIFLYETVNYLIPEQSTLGSEDTTPGRGRLPYVAFINQEGAAFGVGTSSVFSINDSGSHATDFSKSGDWLFTVYQDIATMNFSGSVTVMQGDSAFEFYLYTSTGRKISLVSQTTVRQVEYTLSFSVDFSASKGENFFFVFTGFPLDIIYPFIFIKETTAKLSFKSRYKVTYTRCLRPAYVAQALLDKMTGGGYTFHSDILSQVWENLVITSGDGIRGFDDAVIQTSLDDFLASYNVPANLCMFVKGTTLYIEEKARAFDATIIADLGEVAKLVIKPSQQHQYNVVKIGYPNLDTHDFDSLNAKGEFNITNTFTSPVSRVSKVLDLTSKYKASMFEQELTRINLDGKTTTTDTSDTSVFFKLIEKTITAVSNTAGWYSVVTTGGTKYFVNTANGFYYPSAIPQPPPFPITIDLADFIFMAIGITDLNTYLAAAFPGYTSLTQLPNTSVIGTVIPQYYNVLRETYTSITGLLDPDTAYNIPLSPKRCLLAHGNYLRSVFYWLEAASLVFQTTQISAALKTVKDGITIDESANENIGSFDDPLFIPLELSADSPMPDGMIDIMNSTPEGTIQFEYNGVSLYGFANEVQIQPASKTAQTTTMLCSTQTDLSKLIDR